MRLLFAAALLAVPTAAAAQLGGFPQTEAIYPVYHPPSQAELDLQAEIARHPGQHWVCTVRDSSCLGGQWEPDPTPEQLQAQSDQQARDELAQMRAADAAAAAIPRK